MSVRVISRPQAGYFKLRKYRQGPWVKARIARECMCTIGHSLRHDWTSHCDRFPPLTATIGKQSADVDHVWLYGRPISAEEYRSLPNDPARITASAPIF